MVQERGQFRQQVSGAGGIELSFLSAAARVQRAAGRQANMRAAAPPDPPALGTG